LREGERLVLEVEGKKLLMPNDIVFDRQGGYYFTDHGIRHNNSVEFGGVYYVGSDGTTRRVFYPIWTANGVGLSPDESLLYVAIPKRVSAIVSRSSSRGSSRPHLQMRLGL